jgi:hypothetical protein
MIGVPIEASIGRRVLEEAPGFTEDETYRRMGGVLETGQPDVVEVSVASGDGPIGRVRGSSCTARSRSAGTGCSTSCAT